MIGQKPLIATLAPNLIGHPYIALERQCLSGRTLVRCQTVIIISVPILEVLDTWVSSTFLKNRNFNSCDHVMLAFEVTEHSVIISINHLQI